MSELNLTNEESRGQLTLRDVLTPLFRRKWVLLLSFLGVFLSGCIVASLLGNKYDAQMQIFVKHERVDPVVTSEASASSAQSVRQVTEEEMNSEVELLRSSDLLQRVVLANNLQRREGAGMSAFLLPRQDAPTYVSSAVRHLSKQLHVDVVKKTELIQVSYEAADPRLAYDVLTSLATGYLDKHLAIHRPPGAFDFFDQQTERYRKNLADVEARQARFDRENAVAFPQLERDLGLQKLSEFEATVRQTQVKIAETENRIKDLEEQLKVTPERLSTTHRSSDNAAVLQVLEGTLAALELKRTDMASHYAPGYRPLTDLEAQVEQARAHVEAAKGAQLHEDSTDINPAYLWLREELAKCHADLATFRASEISNNANVQLYRRRTLDLGDKEREQEALLRNAKAEEENYLLYLKKREEARITDALDTKRILNVTIAEAPTVPALPTHPAWHFVLLAALAAIVIAIASALVFDYIDPSVRTAKEAMQTLEIPILAAMPKASRT